MNLDKAIQVAVRAHAKQVDKQGQPYILHPLRVIFALRSDPRDMIIGVLHDVVEDTDFTLQDLIDLGLTRAQANSLARVTRDKEHETYRDFILRCCQHPQSVRVKIADIEDNLARIHTLPLAERVRLERRYRNALTALRTKGVT